MVSDADVLGKMLKLLISLSALSISFSYATTNCQKMQQSQLASINERINQMLGSLYTPPLSKSKPSPSTVSSTDTPTTPTYESTPYTYPTSYPTPYPIPYPTPVSPQLIYMSPPPPPMPWNTETVLPSDYSYPASAFPRAVCPTPYFYGNYPPPPYTPVAYPPYPYPMKPNEHYHPAGYPPVPGYPPVSSPYLPPMGSPPPPYPPLPSPPPPYSVHSPYPSLSPIPSYPTMPYPKPPELPPQYQAV